MNWQRGLLRLWFVMSCVWSVATLWTAINEHGQLVAIGHRLAWSWSFWQDYVAAMLVPWLAILAYLGVRWTVTGFRSN
jgi:hypothetical protein